MAGCSTAGFPLHVMGEKVAEVKEREGKEGERLAENDGE